MTAPTHDSSDALLERLVAQFASPYDFLRELVQNAMDAGSDLVDVVLHCHPGDEPGEVVFELEIVDAGAGMDEEIIDGELTRLFGTSKGDDRTMAGGFGIGFVSVFAWKPERVLVQTGRHGDAWELVFFEDRRFEKRRVDLPLEGTTVRLFRRGLEGEREAIAAAIEDALTRWCRFCAVEITFEDVESGEGPRAIEAPFDPEDVAVLVRAERGPTRCVMAFAAESDAILMRAGLVLAQGKPSELLPTLAQAAGPSIEHVQVRVDSPRLRTGLARDAVVEDADRTALERELIPMLGELRGALLDRIEALVMRETWTDADARHLAYLHAHLVLEHHVDKLGLEARPLLRLATGTAVSLAALRTRARLGMIAIALPDASLELRLVALRSGIPVIDARAEDRSWLDPLLARVGLRAGLLPELVSRADPLPDGSQALGALAVSLCSQAAPPRSIGLARFPDAAADVFGGVAVGSGGVVTGAPWTSELLSAHEVWLNAHNPVVARAMAAYVREPRVAALGLCLAVYARVDPIVDLDPIVSRWRSFE